MDESPRAQPEREEPKDPGDSASAPEAPFDGRVVLSTSPEKTVEPEVKKPEAKKAEEKSAEPEVKKPEATSEAKSAPESERIPSKTDATHYEVLGVKENATQEQIREAYKAEMLKWHPDKNPTNTDMANAQTRRILEANRVIGNPERRKEYDKALNSKKEQDVKSSFGTSGEKPSQAKSEVPPQPQGESTNKTRYHFESDSQPKPKVERETASTSSPPVFQEQKRHRSFRRAASPLYMFHSPSFAIAFFIMARQLEHHSRPYNHQAAMNDINFIMLCTSMLFDLARSRHEVRSTQEVRFQVIEHIDQKLDNLVADLKQGKIGVEEYSSQLRDFKQTLQVAKKDQISMQEELYATTLLKKIDRMETLGKAEENKTERANQAQTKETNKVENTAPRVGRP